MAHGSDGFEFACGNGDIVRGSFIIDVQDRGIISRCAVANAGISGSDVRDMMLAAVEARFGGHRAPHPVGMLSLSRDITAPCPAGQWTTARPASPGTPASSPASAA